MTRDATRQRLLLRYRALLPALVILHELERRLPDEHLTPHASMVGIARLAILRTIVGDQAKEVMRRLLAEGRAPH